MKVPLCALDSRKQEIGEERERERKRVAQILARLQEEIEPFLENPCDAARLLKFK